MTEKRFPATAKRRQEARSKGQVLKSQEVVSALMLLGFVAVITLWLPTMLTKMELLFSYVWSLNFDWTITSAVTLMFNMLWLGIQIVWPIFVAGLAIALASNYLQVGILFSTEKLKPRLPPLNLDVLKRMFGPQAWFQLAKSLLKVILIGYFLYASVRERILIYPALQQLDIGQAAIYLGQALSELAWNIALSFLVLAFLDYLYQRWKREKDMRMSQEEIKEEHKQMEGDPKIKGEIRKRQRAMAISRMMQDMKKADVVITNPTHFAVALRYDPKENNAPYVVAKGQDEVALRMRILAKEYDLVIVENKPLARALYAQVEIGQVIPEELYKAVAEVLAFVYRLKKRKRA